MSNVIPFYRLEFSRPKCNKMPVVLGTIKAINLL
jgi:hypothetical protein